jgi:hypothetical protein
MFGIGSIIKAVISLIIIIILAGGFWYISNLKADLAVSQMNNERLESGIKAQNELIDSMKKDIEAIQNINKELQTDNEKQKQDVKALADRFSIDASGQSRDFGAIAASKPGLIENKINRGTQNVFRCLEIASGSPRTEQELNAKTVKETNRECPSLANPNYKPVTP